MYQDYKDPLSNSSIVGFKSLKDHLRDSEITTFSTRSCIDETHVPLEFPFIIHLHHIVGCLSICFSGVVPHYLDSKAMGMQCCTHKNSPRAVECQREGIRSIGPCKNHAIVDLFGHTLTFWVWLSCRSE